MTATERAAALTRTWTFRVTIIYAALEGLQAALLILEPTIPPQWFLAAKALFIAVVPAVKFMTITPPPAYEEAVQRYREALARDHDGTDDVA